jgi:NAD(P)-dependent dehydrogenase (short-subunit alcohol dehydrogenase family)
MTMDDTFARARPLAGRVAVVTGASRGAGRGIALELGAAGATVYVTGRSSRTAPVAGYEQILAASGMTTMPGTIEDTADDLSAEGGQGIAVRCDHTSDEDVAELFARVEREQGRLDVLVNNAWGGHELFDAANFERPFWEQPLGQWETMIDRGVRNHLVASRHAAPILVRQGHGLVVATTFHDGGRYLRGNLFYDLAKASMSRLAFAVHEELAPHGATSLAVSPGWMRTELVLAAHGATEDDWHRYPPLARTESPRYLGRAVAALAADADVRRQGGRTHTVAELAREYDFTDVDGRRVAAFSIAG